MPSAPSPSVFSAGPGNVSDAQLVSGAIPAIVSTDDKSLIKRGRVKTAADAAAIHRSLFNEDLWSSRKRAMIEAAIGGDAPFDETRQRRLNLYGTSNINWGYLRQASREHQRPFFDYLESVDTLANIPLKTTFLSTEERIEIEPVLAQEITTMLTQWPSFLPLWGQLTLLYGSQGIGFSVRMDPLDWRWQVKGLQELKFPRRTPADVNYLDVVTFEDYMRPDELLNKVQAEDEAEEAFSSLADATIEVEAEVVEGEEPESPEEPRGNDVDKEEDESSAPPPPSKRAFKRRWNKRAVIDALKETSGAKGLDTNNPEQIMEAWKGNDISYGITANTVRVIHLFIRELDGTVSHYIARYDGAGDFLYKCEGKYQDISEPLTAVIQDVGTNGNFHSIRGYGYDLFSPTSGLNKLVNKFLDQALVAATPHLSTQNEDGNIEKMFTPMGPYMLLSSDTAFSEAPQINMSQNLIPAIQAVQGIFRGAASAIAPVATSAAASSGPKTAEQVRTESELTGALQSSDFNMFMAGWERHMKSVVRCICRPDYLPSDPGGREVQQLYRRIAERLVSLGMIQFDLADPRQELEAFDAVKTILSNVDIEAIEVNRGLGKGSVAERRSVVSALNQTLRGRLDPEGERLLDRMTASSYAGQQIGRLLVPDKAGLRPPMDAQIAKMENSVMALGEPPAFEPNQNHYVHAVTHLGRLNEINDEFLTSIRGAPEMDAEGDDPLRRTIDKMQPIWEHTVNDHLPMMDPNNPEYGAIKQNLQQLGEFIKNSRKHLDAEDQRRAEQENPDAPPLYGGVPAGLMLAAQDAATRAAVAKENLGAAKLAADVRRTEVETDLAIQRGRQEMAARDVELALKVRQAKSADKKPAPKAKKR